MKAVVYSAPREFALTELPTPVPAAREVLIRVRQVGICATDLHVHSGHYPAAFPVIPCHEMVGSVAALGDEVTGFGIGELVTVNPNLPCGVCAACKAARFTLCTDAKGAGTFFPGFLSEFTCVPESLVFSAEGLDVDTAGFIEPSACAMHGIEVLGIRPGATALVIGSGPTGVILAQLIAASGASAVTVASPLAHQLDTARRLGATRTVLLERGDPDGNLQELLQANGGAQYDIVVEATGANEVANICVALTANGGTVLIYGVAKPADVMAVHPYELFRREITIKGSYAEMTSFGAAIAALRAGRARTADIITHRYPIEEYATALDAVANNDRAHKVVMAL